MQELLGKGYLNMVRGTIDYKAGQLIHYSVSRIIAQAFDEHDIPDSPGFSGNISTY